MAQAGILGNDIEHIVLLLKIFQIFLPFVFILLVMIHDISPNYQRPSHYILDGSVGMQAHKAFGTMRHILPLRNSCLLANQTLALSTVVILGLFLGSLVGAQDTCPCLLIPWITVGLVAV